MRRDILSVGLEFKIRWAYFWHASFTSMSRKLSISNRIGRENIVIIKLAILFKRFNTQCSKVSSSYYSSVNFKFLIVNFLFSNTLKALRLHIPGIIRIIIIIANEGDIFSHIHAQNNVLRRILENTSACNKLLRFGMKAREKLLRGFRLSRDVCPGSVPISLWSHARPI